MKATLSQPAQAVWGKAGGDVQETWLPLWRHLDDTAEVARYLWDVWLPDNVKRLIGEGLGGVEAGDGRQMLIWLAGIHDVGKVSPAFAIQIEFGGQHFDNPLVRRMVDAGFDFGDLRYLREQRSLLRHELASCITLTKWLEAEGWPPRRALGLAAVVGGHHGRPPTSEQIRYGSTAPELLGTGLWSTVRNEHLDRAGRDHDVLDRLTRWSTVKLPAPVQVLLTAAVIVADWMASGLGQWPVGQCIHEPGRVEQAMETLRLPTPWRAESSDVLASFSERFGLPGGSSLRPVQSAVVEVARAVTEPGLIIVEAPMGEGKTEAALLAAEVLAQRTGAGGLFIGLPTRATASAMFGRVMAWMSTLSGVAVDGPAAVILAHGKASLNETFMGIPRMGHAPDAAQWTDTPADARVAVHRWMAGRKKTLLASFAIGTVDQLLFAALKSKHVVLRHLGLAGKVVIVDEAHAYDVFMSVYLDRAVEWLGAYRVPVVVLSATLPAGRRAALVAAYERGRNGAGAGSVSSASGSGDNDGNRSVAGDLGYPVVVATDARTRVVLPIAASSRAVDVQLERFDEDDSGIHLGEFLADALADGGVAVVIRNTVRRAQDAARQLRQLLPDAELIIAHSRFVAAHRARLDELLLAMFGVNGRAERFSRRYVVVATQVVEQSLDVDFDVMVTDIAPVDLLLQRLGRLHRHQRGDGQSERSPGLRSARCFITGVDEWSSSPPGVGRSTEAIYSQHVLLRTLAMLQTYLDGQSLQLPTDIAPLVQGVYGDHPLGAPDWQVALARAAARHREVKAEKQSKAATMRLGRPTATNLVDWLDVSSDDGEDTSRGRAQVRDTDESVEVLVVCRDADGHLRTLPDIGPYSDVIIPTTDPVPRRLAAAIASCAVSLPRALSHGGIVDAVIAELERSQIPSFQAEGQYLLNGELVLVLDASLRAQIAGHQVSYSVRDGLRVDALPSETGSSIAVSGSAA